MVASVREAFSRALEKSDLEKRMETALMEMHAIAVKKFQRSSDNTLGTVANEMLEVMWTDPRFIKAFVLQWAQWTNLLKGQMDRFCATVQRDMKKAPETARAGVHLYPESQSDRGVHASIPASAGEGSAVQIDNEGQINVGSAPSTQSEEEVIRPKIGSHEDHGPSSSPPVRSDGVLSADESHHASLGAITPSSDRSGEVHYSHERHPGFGPSAAPPNRNDAVRGSHDSQMTIGRVVPMTNLGGGVHERRESHPSIGPTARTPNPPRSLADMEITKRHTHSMFDTITIRGMSLTKINRGMLKTMKFRNLSESALATLILNHAECSDDTMISEIIKESELQDMMKKADDMAKEMMNAA